MTLGKDASVKRSFETSVCMHYKDDETFGALSNTLILDKVI
jgi:hypothetical protein